MEGEQKVILKLINHEYPSLSKKIKLLNEFKMISSLNHKGIIKAYRFEEYEKTYALVLEDIEAKTLEEIYANRKVPLKDFLKISIMLSETIDYIHKNGIIHKDIRPANIIINKNTNEYRIIDFGRSVKSRIENIEASQMDFIEGEFYYIAPEQTGRINMSLDYRSDFYSFGITLYKLITGKLPFETTDLLELIHSHIARLPVSPIEVDSSIPKPISDIIMKLIAKKPEERYQSSQGITYDLTLCLAELEERKIISDFEIG